MIGFDSALTLAWSVLAVTSLGYWLWCMVRAAVS